jgi:exopolysaccharide biosynthesis protein
VPRPTRLLAAALVLAVACALAAVVPLVTGSGDREPRGTARQAGTTPRDRSVEPGQTSEGIRGETVEPVPAGRALPARVTKRRGWRIVPGVRYQRWVQTDRRGRILAHLLTVNPAAPGVRIDYAARRYVPQRGTLTGLLARDRAVAGVNGGFFDIHDTGAPLGVGQDRQRGFLHAARHTWNNAFYLTRGGGARIGRMTLAAQVVQYPQMQITNVNSPRVREAGIGVYGPHWGLTSGYRITDGQRDHVRMVVIQNGRVVANRTTLTSEKKIGGTVLVGRGPGAEQLRQMRVGSTATVRWGLAGRPAVAISGERVLLHDGRRQVDDDAELHPRTAVGIDRDTGRVLLLVVDGRSSRSRGYTLVELARMMRRLGAEEALNLDGGGSSTMAGVGRHGGGVAVLNRPSDGAQRQVADAIGVTYRRPR